MAFRIQRARGTLPIPRRISVDTGGAMVAQAAAGLGEALVGASKKYELMQADTELSEAKRKSTEEINRLAISYRTNLDPDTYQSEYEKSQATIKSYTPNNRRAARVYGQWLNTRSPGWQKGVDDSRHARIDDNFQAEGWKLQQTAVEGGDFTKYRLHLWKGQKLGAYSAEEAAKFLSFGLDARERFEKSESVRIKVENKEAIEEAYEKDRDMLGEHLHRGTLTYTIINATSLPEKEQETYRLKMLAVYDRRLRGVGTENNHAIETKLRSMAWDIPSGGETIKNFKKELEAAYVAEPPLISEDTRTELLTLAEGKYGPMFADKMSERETFAMGQLVDKSNEVDFTEYLRQLTGKFEREQAVSLRKLQWANFDRYKKALNDHFALPKNKDADAGQIYDDSLEILAGYRLTPNELRNPDKITLPAPLGDIERSDILPPAPKVRNESRARTKIYDMWESFSLPTQDKIIQGYKLGKPLTEIMKDKDVEAEIKQALEGPKMPSPKTTREYDLLPSGTRYLHYKGDIRIKK